MERCCILKFIPTKQSLFGLGALLFMSSDALAHGFAQRYDLPVPLTLYLAGAAATLVVSFVIIAGFVRHGIELMRYPRRRISRLLLACHFYHPYGLILWRTLSVLLLALIIAAGWLGEQDPFGNLAPTLVWVIWWVGLAYFSGLVGNGWLLINPWNNSFLFFQWLARRVLGVNSICLNWRLPQWLSIWPALMLFVVFSWIELVWVHSDVPAIIATLAVAYSLLTWFAMMLFGRETWLQGGEAFHRFFELLSRFAPTMKDEQDQQWYLRPYGLGLLVQRPVPLPVTVFVLFMLSVVTYDGFMATPVWAAIVEWAFYSDSLRPLLLFLQQLVGDGMTAIGTLGLLAFPLLFIGAFYGVCHLMQWAAGGHASVSDLAGYFVLTLIPIALAYHLAHYLSFLLIVGQYIIPLISDPFGFGWDLFGGKHYFVDIGIVNARFLWITSVIVIVMGHIVAVFLSHVMAQRVFKSQRAVFMSQLPMLVLMVGYTLASLWILAQPIVE
jgi:hypothetical protein